MASLPGAKVSKVIRTVLFIGDDWYGSNATSMRDAIAELDLSVDTVNTFQLAEARGHISRRMVKKTSPRLYEAFSTNRVTRAVASAVQRRHYDLAFVFKGTNVGSEAVESLRRSGATTVHYHPDDSANSDNVSATYLESEPLYDLHVTTKSHNVDELRQRAPKSRIVNVLCAFDPRWHRRLASVPSQRLGLIGTLRPDRVDLVVNLARSAKSGEGEMLVAGTGWGAVAGLRGIAEVIPPAFGIDFSRTVSRAGVQLGVLNSANRDSHTCRTFEIPAAGGLFLGERSLEHEQILGDTALLYGNPEEALSMAAWALSNPEGSRRLAEASWERITQGGNTYLDRALEILAAASEEPI